MLTLPPAPKRAALLDALAAVVADADPAPLMSPPVAPERLTSALASRGSRRLAADVFRAAGMAEPEVLIMGGSGAATAFRAEGKAVMRMGADLAPSAAIASVIRATCGIWRQRSGMRPAASEDEDVATSAYLSLGAAEALAAHELGERDRAAALVFLVAAQSVARDEARLTAAVARDLGEPLDALYEDALRLLALRGDELRARFRVDQARLPFERDPPELVGSPPEDEGAEPQRAIEVASLDEASRRLDAQPCPCGGRWRVAERAADPADPSRVRFTIVCRVCLRWRTVSWHVTGSR